MLPYFLLTAAFLGIAILFPQRRPNPVAWFFAFIAMVVFVGLRHKIGMDWNNYLHMITKVSSSTLLDSYKVVEPIYATILWASSKSGFGIYGANLLTALVFCFGLFRFTRTTPLPWLALSSALPMLVIVVAMSANRQAAAIGVLLWLVADWHESSLPKRIVFVGVAAMFHFSAAFFLLFVASDLDIKLVIKAILCISLGFFMFWFLEFTGSGDYYDSLYVSGQTQRTYSPAAHLHVLLNGVPALMLFFGKRVRTQLFPSAICLQMAALALLLIPASYFFSTAASRMSFYLFPVSMSVFSAMPGLLRGASTRAFVRTVFVTVFLVILVVWLNYANSRRAYIPYKNVIFMDKWELHL